jgi:hypothetical protein
VLKMTRASRFVGTCGSGAAFGTTGSGARTLKTGQTVTREDQVSLMKHKLLTCRLQGMRFQTNG